MPKDELEKALANLKARKRKTELELTSLLFLPDVLVCPTVKHKIKQIIQI